MPYLTLLQKAMQEKASQIVHSDFKVEISIKNDREPYDPLESHVRLDVKIHKKTTREHLR